MTFYSYQSLKEHLDITTYLRFAIFGIITITALTLIILYLRHRDDTKYRDLFIIFMLAAILVAGIQYNDYRTVQSSASQQNAVRTFVRSVANYKATGPEKVYTNSQNLSSVTLIKIGKKYYNVTFNSDYSSYQLDSANLTNNTNITYVK